MTYAYDPRCDFDPSKIFQCTTEDQRALFALLFVGSPSGHIINLNSNFFLRLRGLSTNFLVFRWLYSVSRRISDGALLHLFKKIPDSGITEDNELTTPEKEPFRDRPPTPVDQHLPRSDRQVLEEVWSKKREDTNLIRYADYLTIMIGGKTKKSYEKVWQIIKEIGLQLREDKTRIVEAEERFDFLGFSFLKNYSRLRRKRVTIWFPFHILENSIREEILRKKGNRALSSTTREQAKEALILVFR